MQDQTVFLSVPPSHFDMDRALFEITVPVF